MLNVRQTECSYQNDKCLDEKHNIYILAAENYKAVLTSSCLIIINGGLDEQSTTICTTTGVHVTKQILCEGKFVLSRLTHKCK